MWNYSDYSKIYQNAVNSFNSRCGSVDSGYVNFKLNSSNSTTEDEAPEFTETTADFIETGKGKDEQFKANCGYTPSAFMNLASKVFSLSGSELGQIRNFICNIEQGKKSSTNINGIKITVGNAELEMTQYTQSYQVTVSNTNITIKSDSKFQSDQDCKETMEYKDSEANINIENGSINVTSKSDD